MRSLFSTCIPSIMVFSNDIWTAYGIKTTPNRDEAFELHSLSHLTDRETAPQPSLSVYISSSPSPSAVSEGFASGYRIPTEIENDTALPTTLSTALATAAPTPTPVVPAPPSATPPPPSSAAALSTSAIAGLCIGIGLAAVLLVYAVFDFLVLRRRRRERALRRAVAVVYESSGISSMRSLERGGGVGDKEMGVEMAEVVGVEKESEGSGWGRKALSLPRRV